MPNPPTQPRFMNLQIGKKPSLLMMTMMMMMMMKIMVVVMILMITVVMMMVKIINGPSAKSKHASKICEHPNQIGKKTLAIDDDDEDDKPI